MAAMIARLDQVYEVLPMAEYIQVIRETVEALARRQALLPLRLAVRRPSGNAFRSMATYEEG